jgi:hypothetical protein
MIGDHVGDFFGMTWHAQKRRLRVARGLKSIRRNKPHAVARVLAVPIDKAHGGPIENGWIHRNGRGVFHGLILTRFESAPHVDGSGFGLAWRRGATIVGSKESL